MMIEIPKDIETVAPEVRARLLVKQFQVMCKVRTDKRLRAKWDSAMRRAYGRLPTTDSRSSFAGLFK